MILFILAFLIVAIIAGGTTQRNILHLVDWTLTAYILSFVGGIFFLAQNILVYVEDPDNNLEAWLG
jgi:hypothetical protein